MMKTTTTHPLRTRRRRRCYRCYCNWTTWTAASLLPDPSPPEAGAGPDRSCRKTTKRRPRLRRLRRRASSFAAKRLVLRLLLLLRRLDCREQGQLPSPRGWWPHLPAYAAVSERKTTIFIVPYAFRSLHILAGWTDLQPAGHYNWQRSPFWSSLLFFFSRASTVKFNPTNLSTLCACLVGNNDLEKKNK